MPVHLLWLGRVVVTAPTAQHGAARFPQNLAATFKRNITKFDDLLADELGGDCDGGGCGYYR